MYIGVYTLKHIQLYLLVIAFSLLFSAVAFYPAKASDFSWVRAVPTASATTNLAPSSGVDPNCVLRHVPIGSILGETSAICVYQAKSFHYGMYEKFIPNSSGGYWDRSIVIGFPGDTAMYKVRGLPEADLPIYLPDSNTLLYRYLVGWSTWGYYAYTIDNLPAKLTRHVVSSPLFSTEYEVKPNSLSHFLPDENGNPTMIRSIGISPNGRWAAVELRPGGLMRVNTETGEKRWFSNLNPVYGQGSDPSLEFAVSDDGMHVAIAGINAEARVYEITEACGQAVTTFYAAWRSSPPPVQFCTGQTIDSAINTAIGGDLRYARYPTFNFDGGELTVRTIPYSRPNSEYQEKSVTLRAPGYIPPQSLDYLALGDSYSSGEGDTEKDPTTGNKYYRDWTDNNESQGVIKEKCHLSTHSYPYKIANVLSLSINSQWNSVACSGALSTDMSPRKNDHKGQDDRLTSLNDNTIKSYKMKALNEFIPGREQQIEFVRKYKPKVITLTAGGNDAGFGKVIESCINPMIELSSTCSYATDTFKKRIIATDLKNQFKKLKELYKALYNASDQKSKIYAFGYPHFINSNGDAVCGLNVQFTDQERVLISESVNYINNIIEAAAKATGIKYVDVQNSLKHHRLCDDGNKAVTGIAFYGSSERNESFHPNPYGHALMTATFFERLDYQSPQEYSWCLDPSARICPDDGVQEPPMPAYFKEAYDADTKNSAYTKLTSDTAKFKKDTVTIDIPEATLQPNNEVTVILYSDPFSLGTLATNAAGGFKGVLQVPESIPVGFHTLVLSGKTFSGEDIDLWQIIEVQGANPDDRDEDGIPDKNDKCMYLEASNIDQDADAIDDACDPFIGDKKDIAKQSGVTLAEVKQKYAIANGKYVSIANVGEDKTKGQTQAPEAGSSPLVNKPHHGSMDSKQTHSKTNSLMLYILSLMVVGAIIYVIIKKIKT